MTDYYFPTLWLTPHFKPDQIDMGDFSICKRKWQVTIFDLYSLVAEKHPVGFAPEIMNTFLQFSNLEIKIKNTKDFQDASEKADLIRALLYCQNIAPTILPFASNYSINDYAGINNRSTKSKKLLEELHEGLRTGITHESSRVETIPHELSFFLHQSTSK